MKSFPAFFDLGGRKVVIAGGGEATARKARLADRAGAKIIFAADVFDAELLVEWGGRAEFRPATLEAFTGAALAFVAEADGEEARRLAGLARSAQVPVNVVDRLDLSDFISPAIVDRGDIVVAVSTSGASPVLARRIRARIEALLPARLSALATFAASFRASVAAKIAWSSRRRFWEKFFDGPIAARILAGDESGASEAMIAAIDRPYRNEPGAVHIVGAGPGDPELLTLRAHRLLQEADVILYDRLVGEGVLDLARRDAAKIDVGKRKGDHATLQRTIEERMIALAREGKTVVRLKGGDPSIFGRGGEEVEALTAAGAPVFVTPGVTAASACAAAALIPLTRRGSAEAVTFITGHGESGGEPDLDWAALAHEKQTLVVYMGLAHAGRIAGRLIAEGRSPTTPVAVVEKASAAGQRVLAGDLAGLDALVAAAGVASPALLIIGEVAALAQADEAALRRAA